MSECLVCKCRRSYPLHRWEQQPPSVLGLPRTKAEAVSIASFTMDVQQCANCGHVFHTEFDFERIPYRSHSNLVYNHAKYWQEFQDRLAAEWIETYDLHNKRIMEIGCGEGTFLKRFLREELGNSGIAFEPGPDSRKARENGIECYREFFHAAHGISLRPDVIICRHVIEHLSDPLDFVIQIGIECRLQEHFPLVIAEVPCIEKALRLGRLNDFLYEHVSNFTLNSFRKLFEISGFEIVDVSLRYDEEVVNVIARPKPSEQTRTVRLDSRMFHEEVNVQIVEVNRQLNVWREEGKKIAFWAGTGKGASFLNIFRLDDDRFPVVVDSDPLKHGGYVPGTGQLIRSPQYLNENPVDIIFITSQWRVPDIADEIRDTIENDVEVVFYEEGTIKRLGQMKG